MLKADALVDSEKCTDMEMCEFSENGLVVLLSSENAEVLICIHNLYKLYISLLQMLNKIHLF